MIIPEGYGAMFPYILVNNTDKYLEFLKHALHAVEVGRTTTADGTIANARIQIGGTHFMVSEASKDYPATKGAFYLFVEHAESAYENAISHGAGPLFEPIEMPYGDRQGGVTDPSGNIWWISQRLTLDPYDN